MYEGTIAEIRLWAGNFAPVNWAFCDGSLISITQNQALYSLIGNYYGGDGRTNFALPDLRGRVPVGAGMGVGLSNVQLAQKFGVEVDDVNLVQVSPATSDEEKVNVEFAQRKDNHQPSLGLNYIICVSGMYPSRP